MTLNMRAVVAGHICLDVIPGLDHLPEGAFASLFQPGRLVAAGPAIFSTGGPVSNTGLALVRLGIPTTLMAKVGADHFGDIVRRLVEKVNPALASGLVVDSQATTSYSVIISPPGKDRFFLHHPGANDAFCAEDVDLDHMAEAALFHFGYPPVMRRMYENSGAELVEIFRKVKAGGLTTSLDMCYPDPAIESGRICWRSILQAALPYVDIFLPSFEEILYMLHRDLHDRFAQEAPGGSLVRMAEPGLLARLACELLEMGVKVAGIKLGDRGLYLRTGGLGSVQAMGRAAPEDPRAWADQEMWAPCFQVRVVGTTGSGDATIAGFLGALLRGFPIRRAVNAAVAVGACNVEAADALSGLRSWEDTMARIKTGWIRLPLEIRYPGWFWSADDDVWVGSCA